MRPWFRLSAATILITASLASAQSAEPISKEEQLTKAFLAGSSCSNVVRADDSRVYVGFGAYLSWGSSGARQPIPAHFEAAEFVSASAPSANKSNNKTFATLDGVVDFATHGSVLYVLTYSGIEEWTLPNLERVAVYPTTTVARQLQYKEHPTGMAMAGDLLYISHGRLGLTVFDTGSKRIIQEIRLLERQLPLESQAVDIAIRDGKALIAMDNFSLVREGVPPFRGFVVYDLRKQHVVREVTGLDPGAVSINASGDAVIVGYGGPLWRFDWNGIVSATKAQPVQVNWKYPLSGHPVGKPLVTDLSIYTCFQKTPDKPGEPFRLIRQVFSRSSLKM